MQGARFVITDYTTMFKNALEAIKKVSGENYDESVDPLPMEEASKTQLATLERVNHEHDNPVTVPLFAEEASKELVIADDAAVLPKPQFYGAFDYRGFLTFRSGQFPCVTE